MRRAVAVAACLLAGVTATACGESQDDDPAEAGGASETLFIEADPSARARDLIPPSRLDAYVAAGRELDLDWSMIAAVSALEDGHRGAGSASDLDEALAIGYELESHGAPSSYPAALRALGGSGLAARALRTAHGYRGETSSPVPIPAEREPFDRPVDGDVRAGFGQLYGRPHLGMDFDAREASEVRAAASGVVSDAGSVPAYGRYVCVLHRFPDRLRGQQALTSCYGYLRESTVDVGEAVERGQSIALSGCSGQSCLSPRVHFVVRLGPRPDALPVDPAPFLRATRPEGAG